MAAAELVEYVAKSLVDDPDAVKVEVVREAGRDRHRAPRRRGRHGQGDRPQRQRRQGAPDAPQGDRRPRRRAGVAGDPLGIAADEARCVTGASGWSSRSSAASTACAARSGSRSSPTIPRTRYRRGSVLYREGSDEPLTVAWSAPVGDGPGWRLRFAEVTDREAAEALRGAYLESRSRGRTRSWPAASTSGTRSSARP